MLSFLTIIGIVVFASLVLATCILLLITKKYGLIVPHITWRILRISGLVLFVLSLVAIFFGFFI